MGAKENNKAAANCQRYAYQLTINNPNDYGWTHDHIKEVLIRGCSTITYFCMADEIGEQGTPHTHIYTHFSSRVRFSSVKKRIPEAHIEPAQGSVEANIDYIKKTGKWADTDKAETRIEGTFEEWGTRPTQKGHRGDMEDLFKMIESGYSNADILALNNDYILQIDKIDKVRSTLLQDKYKGIRRLDLQTIYISGMTGTGKTKDILDTHGDANVYRVTDYLHPFDSYSCQPVIAFEEFRSNIRISDMLNYCDIYPLELPARYTNKYACYSTVYIVSNWPLERQYEEIQKTSLETWRAFLRRISEVRVYTGQNEITTYKSVEEYFRSCKDFRPVTSEDHNPFFITKK